MECLIYIANGMYLLSYSMKDILRLRVLTVAAAICLVGYFYFRPEPMLTVVYWNLFFVALNVLQIVRIVRFQIRRASMNPLGWQMATRAPWLRPARGYAQGTAKPFGFTQVAGAGASMSGSAAPKPQRRWPRPPHLRLTSFRALRYADSPAGRCAP